MSESVIRLASTVEGPFDRFELLGHYRLAVAQAGEELAGLQQRHTELVNQIEVVRSAVAELEKGLADNLTGWAALEEVETWRRDLVHKWDLLKHDFYVQWQQQFLLERKEREQLHERYLALQNSWSNRIGRAATWPMRVARRLLSRPRRSK